MPQFSIFDLNGKSAGFVRQERLRVPFLIVNSDAQHRALDSIFPVMPGCAKAAAMSSWAATGLKQTFVSTNEPTGFGL